MASVTCSVEECEKRIEARGAPLRVGPRGPRGFIDPDPIGRFWSHVEKTDGCWFWRGNRRRRGGYGSFYIHGRNTSAHRAAYEMLVGPIPDALVLDHLCCEPSCVNPSHLEPVTVAENSRRASVNRKAMTECTRGHAMTGDNVVRRKDRSRYCRSCFNQAQRQRRAGYKAERELLTALTQFPAGYESNEPAVNQLLHAVNHYLDWRFEHSEWTKTFEREPL